MTSLSHTLALFISFSLSALTASHWVHAVDLRPSPLFVHHRTSTEVPR